MEIRYEKKDPLILLFKDLKMGDLFIFSVDKEEEPQIRMKTTPVKDDNGIDVVFNSVNIAYGNLCFTSLQSTVVEVDHELIVMI